MKKSKTYFEQIPIDVVRALVAERGHLAVPVALACRICSNPIRLEDCKTDESGRAVHERCYVGSLIADLSISQCRPTPSSRGRNESLSESPQDSRPSEKRDPLLK